MDNLVVNLVVISGVGCIEKDGYYTFTVPGFPEYTVYGIKAARRVIRGRLDPAVRRTLGIDESEVVQRNGKKL